MMLDIEVESDEYNVIQEINKADSFLEKEYLTKEEYNSVISIYPEEKSNMFYIGNYSRYGDYLNLNLYSEHDHDKRY